MEPRRELGRGMKTLKRPMAFLLLLLCALLALAPTASANSAEPPGLTVLVLSPPEDLALYIRFAGGDEEAGVQLVRGTRAWEAYYRFFYHMAPMSRERIEQGAELVVETGGERFVCALPAGALKGYNNLVTLDVAGRRVVAGQPPWRTPLLVLLRVALTLAIEGAVFYAFGYRGRMSWGVFLAVNLVTQGALNAMLAGPNQSAYVFIGYVLIEGAVFAVETAAFALALREHGRGRAACCARAANLFSLVPGGLMLAFLPL